MLANKIQPDEIHSDILDTENNAQIKYIKTKFVQTKYTQVKYSQAHKTKQNEHKPNATVKKHLKKKKHADIE